MDPLPDPQVGWEKGELTFIHLLLIPAQHCKDKQTAQGDALKYQNISLGTLLLSRRVNDVVLEAGVRVCVCVCVYTCHYHFLQLSVIPSLFYRTAFPLLGRG